MVSTSPLLDRLGEEDAHSGVPRGLAPPLLTDEDQQALKSVANRSRTALHLDHRAPFVFAHNAHLRRPVQRRCSAHLTGFRDASRSTASVGIASKRRSSLSISRQYKPHRSAAHLTLGSPGKRLEGRSHSAPGKGDACEGKTQFNAAQRPREHQVVEIPKVADTKDLAL